MTSGLSYSFGVTPSGNPAATVSVTPPPMFISGGLLFMCAFGGVANPYAVVPTAPAGWTALSPGGSAFGVFYKVATTYESTYTVPFSAACMAEVVVAAYPPATISASSFAQIGPPVNTCTPAFPANVTSTQPVLLFAGALDDGATGITSGQHSENLPPGWTTIIPPIGSNAQGAPGGTQSSCIGLSEYLGPTSNPTITSAQAGTFETGFVVLSFAQPSIASPVQQTFTVVRSVNGIVKAHDAGAAVNLANPAIFGM